MAAKAISTDHSENVYTDSACYRSRNLRSAIHSLCREGGYRKRDHIYNMPDV